MTVKVFEATDLVKNYGKVTGVNNLSFAIGENRITGLIGPNGSGKTTLLKLAAGYLRKSSGEIKVFSEDPFNNLKIATNMVFIGENMPLPLNLNVTEILRAAGAFYPNWNGKLANRLFDYFSINAHQKYNNLSKGKKSTFNMIIGISARCPLTLFDEPTSGMDAEVRKDFYRALLNDYVQHPRTIVFSSHLLNEVENLLEDILLMKAGSNVLHMPVEDLTDYAVALRGKAETVDRIVFGKDIIRRESFGQFGVTVILKSDFPSSELNEIEAAGVELFPVSINDLCVYLTSGKKGGIDDAFDRD